MAKSISLRPIENLLFLGEFSPSRNVWQSTPNAEGFDLVLCLNVHDPPQDAPQQVGDEGQPHEADDGAEAHLLHAEEPPPPSGEARLLSLRVLVSSTPPPPVIDTPFTRLL